MSAVRCTLAIVLTALFIAVPASAFHSGGVAATSGCVTPAAAPARGFISCAIVLTCDA